jgi:rhamnogalacturonyl hydrolase YesR
MAEQLRLVHALHSSVAGDCSSLLNSFPPNTGSVITEHLTDIFASIAKLQEQLGDFHTVVKTAREKQEHWIKQHG